MKKLVNVAVAVIENDNNEILISKRQESQHLAGYWEFPGGKIEHRETVENALIREVKEELNIEVLPTGAVIDVFFNYPEKTVCLKTWRCEVMSGTVNGNEGQQWRWVKQSDLVNYKFPKANFKILEALLQKSL